MASHSELASDAQVLELFAEGRRVFDGCDSLREGYYEIKRDAGTGKQEDADTLRHDAMEMQRNLGLADADKELQIDWSYAEAETDANANSNRWVNVRPWSHSSLPQPYLNASSIPPMIWRPLSLVTTSQPFVASQAPLPHTLPDFLHHLISSGCRLLVNLTPVFDYQGRAKVRKSHQYWPDAGSPTPLDAGRGWSVSTLSEDVHTTRDGKLAAQSPGSNSVSSSSSASGTLSRGGSNGSIKSGNSTSNARTHSLTTAASDEIPDGQDWKIIRRRLLITPPENWQPSDLNTYTRCLYDHTDTAPKHPPTNISMDQGGVWTITLLHVESWADGGASSAVNFTRLVELVEETQRRMIPASVFPVPPVWVHCSAGIGRTGTLIGGLIARALITSKEPGIVATPAEKIVLMIWRYLRERRFGMITTPQQAKMIYDEVVRLRGNEKPAQAQLQHV